MRTPVLSADGGDLAAAVQTIFEIGDGPALGVAIETAFPGTRLEVTGGAVVTLSLHQPGLLRPLGLAELSDGTLQVLMPAAALLSPRPPALLVLNEPETSLHHSLIPALASLIRQAARTSQVNVVSHDGALVGELAAEEEAVLLRLTKELGETAVADVEALPWQWPRR